MKKQAFLRGVLGFPLGIAIGQVIGIIASLFLGEGTYRAVAPSLVEMMGNEINAVIFQTALSGVLGAAFAASSVIWEIEEWSIAKQSGLYFLITSLVMMPVAYIAGWMEHSLRGFAIYFAIFVLIFILVWLIQYLFWRRKISGLNAKLK